MQQIFLFSSALNLLPLYCDQYQGIALFPGITFSPGSHSSVEKYIRFREREMGEIQDSGTEENGGKKPREFIVAAAINRVYGRTNEKSIYLNEKTCNGSRLPPAASVELRPYSGFLFVSLTAGSTKFIEQHRGKGWERLSRKLQSLLTETSSFTS